MTSEVVTVRTRPHAHAHGACRTGPLGRDAAQSVCMSPLLRFREYTTVQKSFRVINLNERSYRLYAT